MLFGFEYWTKDASFIKKYALDKNGEETEVMDKNDPSFKNSKIDQI